MDYINVINEETRLNEKLKVLEEKYKAEVLNISTRLGQLAQHKEDFQNGNSAFAFAREYILVHNPLTILQHFSLYMDRLKRELIRDYKNLLTHDLEILDNHGRDKHKYTELIKKNSGSFDSMPNLGSIIFSHEMPVQYFSDLMMELEKLNIRSLETEEQLVKSVHFKPFYTFPNLLHILEYKIKTEEYDYTKLFKLLNFPKEIYIRNAYGEKVGMYKLIGNSYVFHMSFINSNGWVNMSEAYREFLEKNK